MALERMSYFHLAGPRTSAFGESQAQGAGAELIPPRFGVGLAFAFFLSRQGFSV